VPPSTLVLVPAHNEATRIGAVLSGVRSEAPGARLVVIDDGSTDETATVAERHGAVVIRHPFNLGYGAALQTGYHYARRAGCERIAQLDADGQHDPASLHTLFEALERGADIVVGSRYQPPGQAPRTSVWRRIGSRLFSWVVTAWTGIRITDPTSGFQAMNARALNQLVLDHFPEDYPDADVLITLARAGLTLVEVPAKMYERQGGASMHRGGRAAFYAYKMFLTLSLLPIRRTSPYREGRALANASRSG
jgi:glycosyltransferase involved in cell wall biosynthesis